MTIDDMLSQIAQAMNTAPKTDSDAIGEIRDTLHINENTELKSVPGLNLALAKEIAYCVEQGAQKLGVKVVTAIVDGSGRLMLLEAMDGSLIASIQAAQDKAYTAAALRMPTHIALKESRGGAFDGLTNGNGILLLGGGYPIEINGGTVGAIGVSGGTKDQDMQLAQIGINYFSERMKQ